MKLLAWKEWGIMPRVILIAVLPVTLLFFSMVLYSYYSRSAEAREEVDERSRLVASLLAQDSEYGIVSGNLSYLRATVTWLLQTDDNIESVAILDRDRHSLLNVVRTPPTGGETRAFESPVMRALIGVSGASEVFLIGVVSAARSPSPSIASRMNQPMNPWRLCRISCRGP